ncbi:uncharacterized protein LOC113871543 [Abrus precatorius]|uniref:Uncharacterized protein LOC113871543 n=1 Tax=Abrus precatorius TaxID=3816 RepID=A0A8B8M8T8_ABRPR|nr:uncharacterized protein LOC113871543 [Abrus precatorius]
MLYLSTPYRVVARGRVLRIVVENSLHNTALPPHHYKVSIEIVQRQEEDTALPIPNEEANLNCLRDAIGTYVAWPLSLITLRPKVAPSSSRGLGKGTGHTKESIAGPSNKGVVSNSSDLPELAQAQGAACFDMMKLYIRSDQVIDNLQDICVKLTWKGPIWQTLHQHITDMLKRHMGEDHLIFAPYNVGQHWILVAINTSNETMYYMDPLCKQLKTRPHM